MNAISNTSQPGTSVAVTEDRVIEVLRNSLYPGAKPESVALVLAWCRATGRDPMKKPIHIVPMWVKDATTGQGGMRDVLMPGIGTYRSDAASTGNYAGKTEPEFGPTKTFDIDGIKVAAPEWCKVTVMRLVHGAARPFTACEFWLENYASGKEKKGVNDMWRKRPFAQLAKCSESQALRMAFPDETGNTNTAEEMEGRTFEGMTIDGAHTPAQKLQQVRPTLETTMHGDDIPDFDAPKPDRMAKVAERIKARLAQATDQESYNAVMTHTGILAEWDKLRSDRPELEAEVEIVRQATLDRIAETMDRGAPTANDDVSA